MSSLVDSKMYIRDKAIIENTTIPHKCEAQIKQKGMINFINNMLLQVGLSKDAETIKKYVNNTNTTSDATIKTITQLVESADTVVDSVWINEKTISESFLNVIGDRYYRNSTTNKEPPAEEILARMVELFDWLNSADATDTHPIIKTGILVAQIEYIKVFQRLNAWFETYVALVLFKSSGYNMRDYLYPGTANQKPSDFGYPQEEDMTAWLEYFSQKTAYEAEIVKDNIKLLEKEMKFNKTGITDQLDDREQKIVEYLHDYKFIQNKDFSKIFPNISEDSVLRSLKKLADKNIVIKKGSTKSSRYELT